MWHYSTLNLYWRSIEYRELNFYSKHQTFLKSYGQKTQRKSHGWINMVPENFFIFVSNDHCWGRQPLSMNRWNAKTTVTMQYSLQKWIWELEIMDNQQEILHWWSLRRNLAMLLLFMSTTNLILTKFKRLYSCYSCLQWWQMFCYSQSFSFPKRNYFASPS